MINKINCYNERMKRKKEEKFRNFVSLIFNIVFNENKNKIERKKRRVKKKQRRK